MTTEEQRTYNCPVEAAVDVIGSKWKPIILWWLAQRPMRYAEIRSNIPKLSEKVLTAQLRELERDGVVDRTVLSTVPPGVVYSLTPHGEALGDAMKALCKWGRQHMQRIGAVEVDPTRVERGAETAERGRS